MARELPQRVLPQRAQRMPVQQALTLAQLATLRETLRIGANRARIGPANLANRARIGAKHLVNLCALV